MGGCMSSKGRAESDRSSEESINPNGNLSSHQQQIMQECGLSPRCWVRITDGVHRGKEGMLVGFARSMGCAFVIVRSAVGECMEVNILNVACSEREASLTTLQLELLQDRGLAPRSWVKVATLAAAPTTVPGTCTEGCLLGFVKSQGHAMVIVQSASGECFETNISCLLPAEPCVFLSDRQLELIQEQGLSPRCWVKIAKGMNAGKEGSLLGFASPRGCAFIVLQSASGERVEANLLHVVMAERVVTPGHTPLRCHHSASSSVLLTPYATDTSSSVTANSTPADSPADCPKRCPGDSCADSRGDAISSDEHCEVVVE